MAFANLRREERIGLGAALAAHAALLVALAIHAAQEPSVIPLPERMTVSLAEEVSLRDTAPDPSTEAQAAIADTLSEEPAPAPEVEQPVAQPRTQPVAPPPPRANTRPPPEPRPEPSRAASRRGGGSRLGDDFLAGQSTGERSDDAGSPATEFGPREQASLVSAISRQLRPHWNAPQGVDAELLVTQLDWDLNRDGSLAGRPRLRGQQGITDSNRPQASRHAELAIRAVQLAAPFDLPAEYYDNWKRIRNWRFDRNSSR